MSSLSERKLHSDGHGFLGKVCLIQSSTGGGKEKGFPTQDIFIPGHGTCHLIIEGDSLPGRGVLSDQGTRQEKNI